MLLTSGLVPVAQEFSGAFPPGWAGSEFIPVAPECPMTTTPRPAGVGVALAPSESAPPEQPASNSPARVISEARTFMGSLLPSLRHGLVNGIPAVIAYRTPGSAGPVSRTSARG
jgi:hypothetical protein